LGTMGLMQTRRWPRTAPVKKRLATVVAPPSAGLSASAAARPQPAALPPRSDSDRIMIELPGVSPRHPDVWAPREPLDVRVVVRRDAVAPGRAATVRLLFVANGRESEVGHVVPDERGHAGFTMYPDAPLEGHLVARLEVEGFHAGRAVRALRIVPYRDEIVETFEDFVKWAASHFGSVDRRLTAREFVDRYADSVPRAPHAPLDRIADIYELANYSDHPVDRAVYLDFVEAFLELEDAGALEGPGREAA
jgi:hypothetical protein